MKILLAARSHAGIGPVRTTIDENSNRLEMYQGARTLARVI